MRKIIPTLFLILFVACAAFAQDYELGKPSDLKGLTKIFVNTDGDLKNKERIEKKIEKEAKKAKIENLVFTEEQEQAEIVLVFSGDQVSAVIGGIANRNRNLTTMNATRIKLETGGGAVFVKNPQTGKARLVFRYQNNQESKWEDTPAVKLASEFVKNYKTTNGIK